MTSPTTPHTPAWETSCPSCKAWQADPKTGAYRAGCDDCAARHIAQSAAAWRAAKGITAVELQDELRRAFGEENYAAARTRVWAWMKRLKIGGLAQ